jgi:hypothetical protein
MQLGTYANAEDYDHTLGTRSPLVGNPRKDWAVVMHLPAGTGRCELKFVDIASGYETAKNVAPLIHAWRKRKDLAYDFIAESSAPIASPTLVEQINTATSEDALRALYAMNADRWTPGLTALAKERIEALKAKYRTPALTDAAPLPKRGAAFVSTEPLPHRRTP